MGDGAPVCNLPNIGQVPALQPGRRFPAVPKAQDLPSAIAAINTLTQIILQLTQPGFPPFRNNLATFNAQDRFVGTGGITQGAGADGSPGAAGKKGDKGEDAKQPNWELTRVKTEKVKVVNPEDDDQFVIVKRIIEVEFSDRLSNSVLLMKM